MKETALTRVQEKVDGVIQKAVETSRSDEAATDFIFRLGEINAVNVLARNLESAVIVGLQRIRDEQTYTTLGYSRFDEFLDDWYRSPMKYKRFNYLENIHSELGADGFDLMRGSGLSYRQMKMLEAGDVVIEGQEVVIGGGDRVSLGDSRVVKDLVERLIQDRAAEKAEKEKLTKKVEKQKEQIDRGTEENEELRRALDSVDETTRFERAFMTLTNAFWNLTEVVGELDDSEKAARATRDLKDVAGLYFALSDAYGVKQALTDDRELKLNLSKPVEQMTEAEKRETFLDRATAAVMADDISDEEEN